MNHSIPNLSFEEIVQTRQSVRQYQPDIQIPKEDLLEIIRLAQTAPSAWNLQHWRVIVIQDAAQKRVLFPIANHQQQILDASAVFIILGDLEADKNTESIYLPLVESEAMSDTVYTNIVNAIKEEYEMRKYKSRDSAFLNASLFAIQLMLAAKSKGYDTVPMGGFQADKLIDALHIPKRYVPVMMIPIGLASSSAHATTRLPLEEVIVYESF